VKQERNEQYGKSGIHSSRQVVKSPCSCLEYGIDQRKEAKEANAYKGFEVTRVDT
jgi:hypothetical protein